MDLEILKIASYTDNNKIIKGHTHISKQKNPLCGDEMEISLRIKDGKIIDFGFIFGIPLALSVNVCFGHSLDNIAD